MPTSSQSGSASVKQASALFFWVGLIIIATVLLIVFAAKQLKLDGVFRPEIVLPLLVIAGVVALLVTLAIAAATFGLFGLSDKSQALALPAGSVQAVIALSLILIFAVVSLYASGESGTQTYESSGLTPEEFRALPPEQVVESHQITTGGEVTYSVVRSIRDPDAKDMNTQLLTTVSTLVIAVAGFYFGSKSVQEGSQAAIEAATPARALNVVNPTSPHEARAGEQLTDIKVQTVPPDAQLRWSKQGDDDGELVRREDGGFVYTPGKEMGPDKSVTLHFEQVDDPKISDALVIAFVAAESAEQAPEAGSKPRTDDPPRRAQPLGDDF